MRRATPKGGMDVKHLKKVMENKSDFEEFVYERFEDASIYLNKETILFRGGLFIFEETQPQHDLDGFEMGITVEKKYCTIEKVRRELLQKEKKGNFIESLDQYDENKAIAHIVLCYGV